MKNFLANILQKQATRYIDRNNFIIVAVTGSVGKTSTTQAISTVLSEKYSVRTTKGNYNSEFGVPLSILNNNMPGSLKNPFGWLMMFAKNEVERRRKPDFEVLVLELGTDMPGDIKGFSWLKPDYAVVTAIAPEHMEFFKDINAVAEEELSVIEFSKITLVNSDSISAKYIKDKKVEKFDRKAIEPIIDPKKLNVIGGHSLSSIAAAIAVGKKLGLNKEELSQGAMAVKPINGRMNKLHGISSSTLIDDTYNSSPAAALAALDYLYSTNARQRIALLGNMNELGLVSAELHEQVGEFCDPNKLDLVVTLGADANKHLAKAAKEQGCKVETSQTPNEAAEIIKKHLQKDAIILLKGSQNGVFAEEATKTLLENVDDAQHLVRQTDFWLDKKQQAGMLAETKD